MPDQFYPYSGVVRPGDAPSAADAARILRAHFGFGSDPQDSESGIGDPSGVLQLAHNRGNEISELEDRLPNEEGAAVIPVEGFVPGEPGRRFTSQLPLANVITDRARLKQLQHAESADPFTGDDAQARTQQVQDALDAAATTNRQEVGDAARTVAERNAFAAYMKEHGLKMADYEAAGSPAARAAAQVPIEAQLSDAAQAVKDADLRRQGIGKMQPQLVPGQTVDANGRIRDAPVKAAPNASEETQLRAIDNTWAVVRDLKALLDPAKNQISNALANRAMFPLYKAGIDPAMLGADPSTRKRFQLASLVQILGSTPYANMSRNYSFIQDVRQHLTNPEATDQFLYGQIEELQKRLPEFRDTIERVHKYPWQRPDDMTGGDGESSSGEPGGNADVSATIRSDPGASTAPAAPLDVNSAADAILRRPSSDSNIPRVLHPKYRPPTAEELGRR